MIPLGIWDLGFYNGFREEDESREEREEKKKKGREVLKGGKKGSHHLLSTYDKWAPIGRSKCYFTLSLPYSNEINSITILYTKKLKFSLGVHCPVHVANTSEAEFEPRANSPAFRLAR